MLESVQLNIKVPNTIRFARHLDDSLQHMPHYAETSSFTLIDLPMNFVQHEVALL